MSDPQPSPPGSDEDSPPPAPYLEYTNRAPPPISSDPLRSLLHFTTGFVTYSSLLVTMKLVAMRYSWDVAAICGTWVFVMIVSFGIAGWLAGAHGWRGAMAGVILAFVISLILSGMVIGEP